jgi:hypothetical protein
MGERVARRPTIPEQGHVARPRPLNTLTRAAMAKLVIKGIVLRDAARVLTLTDRDRIVLRAMLLDL